MINASDNFLRAWAFALQWEGGELEDVPGDAGGLTKYGVDQASHPHVDIAALTADEAGQIYHDEEWTRCRCDELPADLAVAVFDFAMNAGMGVAIRKLQLTLGVDADGFIGPVTLAAAQTLCGAMYSVPEYLARREDFYRQLAADRPALEKFLDGWLNRVAALRQLLAVSVDENSAGNAAAASGGTAAAALPPSKATSASVDLVAPIFLALGTCIVSGLSYFRLLATTPPPEFTGWLSCLAFAGTLLLLFLHIRKEMRPDPPLEKRFASVERVDGIEEDIEDLKITSNTRHTENVRRLDEMSGKLDRNWKEVIEKHDALRVDMRHDVRDALQPLTTAFRDNATDSEKLFRELAGQIGGLKASVQTNDALAAEVRQLMATVLLRLPNTGGGQG